MSFALVDKKKHQTQSTKKPTLMVTQVYKSIVFLYSSVQPSENQCTLVIDELIFFLHMQTECVPFAPGVIQNLGLNDANLEKLIFSACVCLKEV